jgi:hypothetical protein
VDLVAASSEAPEAEEIQDGDDAEESQEETSLTMSPPPALSEDLGVESRSLLLRVPLLRELWPKKPLV